MVGSENNHRLDPSAWVDRYGDSLYRYALSRLRDPEAAEEVVQQTFLAALRAKNQYTAAGSEGGWLMGILKRKIVDEIRRRWRLSSGENAEGDLAETLFDEAGSWQPHVGSSCQQPSSRLERDEFWQMIRDCLSNLPQRQADAFVLRELEGLRSEEICKELAISSSNLWVLLYRARLRLSACISARPEGS